MAARCRKFVPNLFNKTKCQSCFGSKEHHSAEALEGSKAARKISKCSYLFVAPDLDFNNPLHRSKRWQRRFFVLYDDGELTYSVDDIATTVPQGSVDMSKCTDVFDAEERTGHEFAIGIDAPPQPTLFVKGVTKEEIKRWFDVLVMYPRSLTVKTKRQPAKTGSGLAVTSMYTSTGRRSDDEDKENNIISSSLDSDTYDRLSRSRTKPKIRDWRRSKSEVRPSDLKLASEEMFSPDANSVSGTSASLQHKELPSSVPSEARVPTSATPSTAPAAVSSARTIPSAVAARRPESSSHLPAPASPVYRGPSSSPAFGVSAAAAKPPLPPPASGPATSSLDRHSLAPVHITATAAGLMTAGPASAVAAASLPPKPAIKEPLLTRKVEPETYSSVRSLKHKKLGGNGGAINGSIGSSSLPPSQANGLARSTSMQDVSGGGSNGSGGSGTGESSNGGGGRLAAVDGLRGSADLGSRDDLSLLRPSIKGSSLGQAAVVVNGDEGVATHQHKPKTLYESLVHPEPTVARPALQVPPGSKEKWHGGSTSTYQQLASVPKARQSLGVAAPVAADRTAAPEPAAAGVVPVAGGVRSSASSSSSSGGRSLLLRSSTPVDLDHDTATATAVGARERLDAHAANETDEHKIAKSEQQNKKMLPEKSVVIRKGWLMKQEATKENQKHWFVLYGTALAFYKDAKSEESGQIDGVIDITTCHEVSVVNMDRSYWFRVRTRDGDYLLSAMTSGIRRNWIDDIEKIMLDLRKAEEKNVKQNMGFVFVPPLRSARGSSSSIGHLSAADSVDAASTSSSRSVVDGGTALGSGDRFGRGQRSDSVSTEASIDGELSLINSSSHGRDAPGMSTHDAMDGSPSSHGSGEHGYSAAAVVRSLRSAAGRPSSRTSPSQRLKERSRSKTPPRVRSPPPPPISYDESPVAVPQAFSKFVSGKLHPSQQQAATTAEVLPAAAQSTEASKSGGLTSAAQPSTVTHHRTATAVSSGVVQQAAPQAAPHLPTEVAVVPPDFLEKYRRLESDLKAKTDRIAVLEKKVDHTRQLEEECSSRSTKLVTIENLLSNTRRHLDEALERNRELELQQQSNRDELEAELEAEREGHAETVRRLEERLERFLNQTNIADSRSSSMADVLREKNSTILQLEATIAELEQRASADSARDEDLSRLSSENEVLKQRLHVLQHRLEQLEHECQDLRRQCGSAQEALVMQTKVRDKQLAAAQQETAGLKAHCASLLAECQQLRQHKCPSASAAALSYGDQQQSDDDATGRPGAHRRHSSRQSWQSVASSSSGSSSSRVATDEAPSEVEQSTESHLAALAHWQAALTRIVSSASACTLASVMAATSTSATAAAPSAGGDGKGSSGGGLSQMSGSFSRTLTRAQRDVIGDKLVAAVDEELSNLSRQLGDMVRAHAETTAKSLGAERDALATKVLRLESAASSATEAAAAQAVRWQTAARLCRAELAHVQDCLRKRASAGQVDDSVEWLSLTVAALTAVLSQAESCTAAAAAATSSLPLPLSADSGLSALCERLSLQAAVMHQLLAADDRDVGSDPAATIARLLQSTSSDNPEEAESLRSYCSLFCERLLVGDSLDRALVQIASVAAVDDRLRPSEEGAAVKKSVAIESALALEAAYRVHVDGRPELSASSSSSSSLPALACVHGQLSLVRDLCRRAESPNVLASELEKMAAQRLAASDDLANLLDEHCVRRAASLAAAGRLGNSGVGDQAAGARLSSVVRGLLLALVPRLLEQQPAADSSLVALASSSSPAAESLIQDVVKKVVTARECLRKSDGDVGIDLELATTMSKLALTEARMVLCLRQLGTACCRQPRMPSLTDGERTALAAEADQCSRVGRVLGCSASVSASATASGGIDEQRAAALATRLASVDAALEQRHASTCRGRVPSALVMRETVFAAQLAVARYRWQQQQQQMTVSATGAGSSSSSSSAAPVAVASAAALAAARAEADSLRAALHEARAELAAVQSKPSAELQVRELQDEIRSMRERHALELEESKKDMRMVLKSVTANEHRLDSDLAVELAALRQQLAAEKARHQAELEEAARGATAGHSHEQELEANRQEQVVLKGKVRDLEQCLHEMQADFDEELFEERQAHMQDLEGCRQERLELLARCDASGNLDFQNVKAAYEKEIEKLRAEKQSLQQWITEIREAHKDEIEALHHEKEVALADESSAAQAALDSLQHLHEARLAEERLAGDKLREMAAAATAELERKIKIYLLEIESKDREIANLQGKEQQHRQLAERLEVGQVRCLECVEAWRQQIAQALLSEADGHATKSQLQSLADAAAELAAALSPVSQVLSQRQQAGRTDKKALPKSQNVTATPAGADQPKVPRADGQALVVESAAPSFTDVAPPAFRRSEGTAQRSGAETGRAAGSAAFRLRRMTHDGTQSLLAQMPQLKDQSVTYEDSHLSATSFGAYGLNRCKSSPMIANNDASRSTMRQMSTEHLAAPGVRRGSVTIQDLQQFNMSGGRSLADRLKRFERT